MNRKQALAEIWRKTHSDFKGRAEGVKSVMILRNGGSTVVPLEQLTDAEISRSVPAYQPQA